MVFLGVILKVANHVGMLPGLHKHRLAYYWRSLWVIFTALSIDFHTLWFHYTNYQEDFTLALFALGLCLTVSFHTLKTIYWMTHADHFLRIYFRLKSLYDDPLAYRRSLRASGCT